MDPNKPEFAAEPVGVNKASVFEGFCARHDDLIFAPIEKSEPSCCPEHALLFAYRAVSHEVYAKLTTRRLESRFRTLDRGTTRTDQQVLQESADIFFEGNELGLGDMFHVKERHESLIQGADFQDVEYLFVRFNEPSPFLCASATTTEFDFSGQRLQHVQHANANPLDVITFTIANVAGRAAAIFCWLKGQVTCRKLVNSLLSDRETSRLGALVFKFAMEHCENVFMSPKWWGRLPKRTRSVAIEHAISTVAFPRGPGALVDCGLDVPGLTYESHIISEASCA